MSLSMSGWNVGDIVRVSVPKPLPARYKEWARQWQMSISRLHGAVVMLVKKQEHRDGWYFEFIRNHSDHIVWESCAWKFVEDGWLTEAEVVPRQGCLFL